jgi:hypothetical protein
MIWLVLFVRRNDDYVVPFGNSHRIVAVQRLKNLVKAFIIDKGSIILGLGQYRIFNNNLGIEMSFKF